LFGNLTNESKKDDSKKDPTKGDLKNMKIFEKSRGGFLDQNEGSAKENPGTQTPQFSNSEIPDLLQQKSGSKVNINFD